MSSPQPRRLLFTEFYVYGILPSCLSRQFRKSRHLFSNPKGLSGNDVTETLLTFKLILIMLNCTISFCIGIQNCVFLKMNCQSSTLKLTVCSVQFSTLHNQSLFLRQSVLITDLQHRKTLGRLQTGARRKPKRCGDYVSQVSQVGVTVTCRVIVQGY